MKTPYKIYFNVFVLMKNLAMTNTYKIMVLGILCLGIYLIELEQTPLEKTTLSTDTTSNIGMLNFPNYFVVDIEETQSGPKISLFTQDSLIDFYATNKAMVLNPGGIATDLQLWLKANAGVSSSGENLTLWEDQSNNNGDMTPHTSVRTPDVIVTGANFNPYVDFNEATNDRLNGANYNLSGNNVSYQLFFVYKVDTSQPANVFPDLWDWDGAEGDERIETFNGNFRHSNGSSSIVYGKWNLAIATSSLGSLTARLNGLNGTGTGSIDGVMNGSGAVSIGAYGAFDGELAEIIYYSVPKTGSDLNRVESYLALKYGISLNTGVGQYSNANGGLVYDLTTYGNDIVGIAKDNASLLDQRISTSDNTGAILTLSTDANYSAANTSHTDALTNGQYLIMGNNGASISLQSTELANGYSQRTAREWKIANTGNVGSVHLKFDGFDANYVVLVDNDGDFSTGATQEATPLNANGEIVLSNLVHGTYITLALLDVDTDGDGVFNRVDEDDDNDGILDSLEQDVTDGLTVEKAFTSLGMARNVTTAGDYFFNLSGTAFSSYVDENGYVLVAKSFANDPAGNLPQTTTLTNTARGILTPAVLSSLSEMETVRVYGTSSSTITSLVDVTNTDAALLQRVQNNATLHKGLSDNALNENWTGIGAATITLSATCNTLRGSSLHQNVIHICGDSSGFHWIPSLGLVKLRNNEGGTESIALFVQAPAVAYEIINSTIDTDGDGVFDHLDLDTDNDGIPDVIEAQTTLGYIAPNADNAATYLANNGVNSAFLGGFTPVNTSGVDAADYRSLDSDADGVFDIVESGSGLTDVNNNGETDGVIGLNGFDNILDNGDNYVDVNGSFDNSQADNFTDVDADVNVGGDVDYRDADADNDGIDNDIDIDDDNDGILDIDEVDVVDGLTVENPFTSLGMARNVTSAGVYFFNLAGTSFSTYVNTDGYVQIAISFGSDASGNLPQSTALSNTTKGILTPAALATLVDATEIRINGTQADSPYPEVDITTTNSTLLQRIRNNETLHKGQPDNGINNGWTGVLATALTNDATCNGSGTFGSVLHQNIVHVCGHGYGLHWMPGGGYIQLLLSEDNIGDSETLQLWVRASAVAVEVVDVNKDTDGDGIINSLDLDSDNDGILDNIEGQFSLGYIAPTGLDDDADGLDNAYDPDQGGSRIIPINTDVSDEVDFLDLDADNDGIPDSIEAQTTRGYISPLNSINRANGIDGAFDPSSGGVTLIPVNTDATGFPDYRDLDSDGDGVFDIVESGSGLTHNNGVVTTTVGTNGFVNSLELADDYTDVNGSFDNSQTDNFTDTDGDVLTIGDVDFRDVSVSGTPMITQIYHHGTDRWIEITNVHASNTVDANSITVALYNDRSGDQTGSLPTANYTYPNALAAGQSILLKNTNAVLTNTNVNAVVITNNTITDFDGANDIIVLTTQTNTESYAFRYDEVYAIKNSSSYVRNDNVVVPTVLFNENNWTVFVDANLDPNTNPPERHFEAPLVTEIATANVEANIQLGLHRINAIMRFLGPWDNGFPDRSRRVTVLGDFEQAARLDARELVLLSNSNLTLTNNVLVVSDSITSVNGGRLRMVGNSQLVQTHKATSLIAGTSGAINLQIDQESTTASIYRYNYWSSPVVENNVTTFRIAEVMKDGTIPTTVNSEIVDINFIGGYNGATTTPISIASYWLYSFATGAWNATGNLGLLQRADGYLLKGPGVAQNYTFTGTPNDGVITSPIAANAHKLIGNPFPSAMDATKFIRDNQAVIDGTLYFWEHTGEQETNNATEGHYKSNYQGGYATRNLSMGVAASSVATGTAGLGNGSYQAPGPFIAIAQGFFVQATATGGDIIFNNSMRTYQPLANENSVFYKGESPKNTLENKLPIVKLGFEYTSQLQVPIHRQIGISFKKGNTRAYESGFDSEIYDLQTNENDMYWNFEAGKNYVIAGVGALSEELEIPLTVQIKTGSPIKISLDAFEHINGPIYLFDTFTHKLFNLKKESASLNLSKGTYRNRFYVCFKNTTLSVEDSIENNSIQLYHVNKSNLLQFETINEPVRSVKLFNSIGQLCQQWNLDVSQRYKAALAIKELPTGVYIVKVLMNSKAVSKKIIVY